MRIVILLTTLTGFVLTEDPSCTPSKIWLDVVIVIDTSVGMSNAGVTQVLADISSVFGETIIAQGEGEHSRVAVVTYDSKAEVRHSLTDFKSTEEMMEAIWDIPCSSETVSNLKAYDKGCKPHGVTSPVVLA
ncbi:hypothetical protein Y032_0038g3632 [Ancylostoma ceylanicum]|uniref:VWFA domain-containing protein n=1 Tax=Ancylostoma ceylanicum TaxID=53326 RepID=A0A016UIC3_9BILA|nr:hypothetical protein Y032_0038g3632 [Ancylostoma ceylanicum]